MVQNKLANGVPPGQPLGNYAAINFGVGYKDGKTWLSIFQNAPTTNAQYQGKVELKGDISDKCYYENGQYCGATGCNANGCTVSISSRIRKQMANVNRSPSALAQLHSSFPNSIGSCALRNDRIKTRLVHDMTIHFSHLEEATGVHIIRSISFRICVD